MDWGSASAFDADERLALALADAMTGTPAEVEEQLWHQLRGRFSERQLVELASAIAWENYRARWNRVFAVEAEGFSGGAYCPLPSGR